ncbi:hypothetical protein [Streptomyces sp. ST2-7A]|uniref:zinc finger domain-containing protein n=1 Tax=Streptomyces sp. ST2-7A TaxID=2907214 RepID=UPI001F414F49|nr:hypothetical protein [Streptomyces sp. ST2-7A]MCE7081722.1 hypothetical protein [Streptomyces sp. ST2-7A]
MDRRESAALLAYIGRLDPRTIRTDPAEVREQLDRWHELLAEVPAATPQGWDARVVAREHVLTSPYPIMPVDIARAWRAHRRDRLQRHTDPTPGADPDDPVAWNAELAGTRRAVASGRTAPVHLRQITGARPRPELEARLREVGSCIPARARAALAPYRPARAAREAAIARGLPDALTVRCEWCHAPVGEPCRRRRIAPDGAARGSTPRATPHPGRVDRAAAHRARQPETT